MKDAITGGPSRLTIEYLYPFRNDGNGDLRSTIAIDILMELPDEGDWGAAGACVRMFLHGLELPAASYRLVQWSAVIGQS